MVASGTRNPSSSVSHAKASRSRAAAEAEKSAALAAARARAAERDREEWESRRGAGSDVVVTNSENLKDSKQSDPLTLSAVEVVPRFREVLARPNIEDVTNNMDRLLTWGIGDYTVLPKILGRGRFSSVFLAEKSGEKVAIKHTPLFPHHHLIATRLLREPNLLAELPPHPNLVAVKETIRTPGHFYLVEEFLDGYVTLEALVTRSELRNEKGSQILAPAIAERVFCQLLFALHAIHWPLRVCHRDVKPENVLVHPETLQLKLLDFGLATHFSKSHPKLTTCCGSPAFHCPEIVTALARTPGSVAYWGPEVDAWTCGLTLLRCLCGLRYPLGTSHSSLSSMANRAKNSLALVQPHTLRERIALLLDLDGEKRMRNFDDLVQHYLARQKDVAPAVRMRLKSTSFIPIDPQHKMPLPLLDCGDAPSRSSADGTQVPAPYSELTLINYTRLPSARVISFIKYCLRCAGILYYILPVSEFSESFSQLAHAGIESPSASPSSFVLQCVLELPDRPAPKSLYQSFMQALGFCDVEHPVETPRRQNPMNESTSHPASGPSGKRGPVRSLVFYMYVYVARRPFASPPLFDQERHAESAVSGDAASHAIPARSSRHSRDESASPENETHAESLGHTSPTLLSRARSRTGRGTRVRVFVSDSRAVPYVRAALSVSGVVCADDEVLGPESHANPPSHTSPRGRHDSGSTSGTPKLREADLPPTLRVTLHAEGLAVRLGAIAQARDVAFRSRREKHADAAHDAQHLNTLVARLYLTVDNACKSIDAAAIEALKEQNFAMLDVLSPLLALVSSFDTARPHLLPDGSMLEVKTTGCLSLSILETISHIASAKEMLLGIQEQIERVCVQQVESDDEDDGECAVECADYWPPSDRHAQQIQELLGLVRLLSSVHPEVRSRHLRATVQPTVELLYPPVFRDVIAPALGRIHVYELAEELATQGTMLLCEFVLDINARLEEKDTLVAGLLKELLIGSICAMFGSLPHTGGMQMDSRRPAAVFVPPTRDTHVSWRITVWNVVRKTLDEMGLDLSVEALGDEPPALSQSAFLLMTQLTAYEAFMASIKQRSRERLAIATASGTRLAEPHRWSRETALELLVRISRVTQTSLFPGLDRLDDKQGASALSVARSSFTGDAYCTFCTWALDAFDRTESQTLLGVEVAAPLVRALALTAATAPEVQLRSECFTVVSRIVHDRSTMATATVLLDELLGADPPLAASAVNLMRDMIARGLDAPGGMPELDVLLAFLWQRDIFKLPELPGASNALAPFLAQYTALITECCSLYYYLYLRDTNGITGARKHYTTIDEQFLSPLASWTTKWHDDPSTQWLGLINIGLARIHDAVNT